MTCKKVLVGLAVFVIVSVGVLAAVVAMQPTEFRIERSADIAAPAPDVFEQVNDLHNWESWSPWAKLDPQASNTFEGPSSGVGAIFRWAGNDDVGEGSMTILESRPSEFIRIRLDFVKPFEDTSITEFTFHPADEGTRVVWTMTGEHNFLSKAFCLFMDMDQMIGSDFEQGLANMKAVVESGTGSASAG